MTAAAKFIAVDLDDDDPADVIMRVMRHCKLTQSQMADLLGVTRQSVNYWIRKKGRCPAISMRAALWVASMLGVKVTLKNPAQLTRILTRRSYLSSTAKHSASST